MSRVNMFKRYYQHEETGNITAICWGNIDTNDNPVHDFSIFKSPATISRWYPIADCEFIGITDKNGKEIFEGDVVLFADFYGGKFEAYMGEWQEVFEDLQGAIVFEDGAFCITRNNDYAIPLCEILPSIEFEVIGNIYENPELL